MDHDMSHQTGTLINDRYILSSATQLFGYFPYMYKVALGYHLMCQNEFTSTIYSVQEIIIHPSFYHGTSMNNIALLKISVPVPFTRYISPICLPTPEAHYDGKLGTVASWFSAPMITAASAAGVSSTTVANVVSPVNPQSTTISESPIFPRSTPVYAAHCIPHKIGLPIHTGQHCNAFVGINEGCIGVGGAVNMHLCQKDSGSGIFYPSHKGYYELVGILSNKQLCNGEVIGSKSTTKNLIQSTPPAEGVSEIPIDEPEEPEERSARFIDTLSYLMGIPTFAKITDHLEWILSNTKDALYCHKI
ncbi:prostasin-like [Phlebotomus argentipes]|uniref:prostasin-like n=1 Tax=Phlebotomus argentipes TaxID=94469 RepID=UPI00289333B7|nr:prostasin-like [Phlebotomus argentipes]